LGITVAILAQACFASHTIPQADTMEAVSYVCLRFKITAPDGREALVYFAAMLCLGILAPMRSSLGTVEGFSFEVATETYNSMVSKECTEGKAQWFSPRVSFTPLGYGVAGSFMLCFPPLMIVTSEVDGTPTFPPAFVVDSTGIGKFHCGMLRVDGGIGAVIEDDGGYGTGSEINFR